MKDKINSFPQTEHLIHTNIHTYEARERLFNNYKNIRLLSNSGKILLRMRQAYEYFR